MRETERPGADGSIVPAARRSEVSAARGALLAAQVKQINHDDVRGDLVTPWMTLKVWAYKKVSEQKPPDETVQRSRDGRGGRRPDGDARADVHELRGSG